MIYSNEPLLMGAQSGVASKRLHVLHIRPNLQEIGPFWTGQRNEIRDWKRGSTHADKF